MTSDSATEQILQGWGEVAHGRSDVVRPRTVEAVQDLLRRAHADGRPLGLRGAGQSYGDAALHDGGEIVDLSAMRRIPEIDAESAEITVECGVTIEELWRAAVRAHCWPAVVPGTMRATVGGCVAMHVHGKNQYRDGGFGEHVVSLDVVLPGGELRTLRSGVDDELLRAVVGGLGLLGVVTSARLRLQPLESGLLEVEARAFTDVPSMLVEMDAMAAEAHFVVGWIDAFHDAGRGVLHGARRLDAKEDPRADRTLRDGEQDPPDRLMRVIPRRSAARLMRPFARPAGVRAVNSAKFHAASRRGRHTFRQSHAAFHFLLDYVPGWKAIYRPGGLVQHQSFVPHDAAPDFIGEVLDLCREAGLRPWLAVLKRHRDDQVLLTHALDGYSLALDFPVTAANKSRLFALCRRLDERLVAVSGRMYAAKDLTATPETFAACHPGLDRFRELKRELDPRGVLTSDLAKRLGVV